MTKQQYDKFRDNLINEAFSVSDAKGKDYTKGNKDILHNFKSVAKRLGINPYDALMVYKLKHQDAINNYVKSKGQSESEPIRQRIIDDINYSILLLAMIEENNEPSEREQNEK